MAFSSHSAPRRSMDMGLRGRPLKRLISIWRERITGLKAGVNGRIPTLISPFGKGEAKSSCRRTLDGYLLDVVASQGIRERRDISGSDTFGRHDIRNAIWKRGFCGRKIRLFDARCHLHRGEEKCGCQIISRGWDVEGMSRVDKPGEGPRKQKWADDESDGAQAADRALQFALFLFAHMVRHDSLRGWKGNIPHRNHGNRRHVHRATARESRDQHSDRAEKLADVKGSTFAEPGDDSSGQTSRNHGRAHTDNEK